MIQLLIFIVAFSLVAVIAEYFKVIDKLRNMKRNDILSFINGFLISLIFAVHDSNSFTSKMVCSIVVVMWVIFYKALSKY